jgi:hypothetical protein
MGRTASEELSEIMKFPKSVGSVIHAARPQYLVENR